MDQTQQNIPDGENNVWQQNIFYKTSKINKHALRKFWYNSSIYKCAWKFVISFISLFSCWIIQIIDNLMFHLLIIYTLIVVGNQPYIDNQIYILSFRDWMSMLAVQNRYNDTRYHIFRMGLLTLEKNYSQLCIAIYSRPIFRARKYFVIVKQTDTAQWSSRVHFMKSCLYIWTVHLTT